MPKTDVRTEGQHFQLSTAVHEGKIFAEVWDFGLNRIVLQEPCKDFDQAKRKCEEYAKANVKDCPPIVWNTFVQPQVCVNT